MTTLARLLVVVGLVLGSAATQACKCNGSLTPARHFERAEAVVSGLVEGVEPVDPAAQAIKASFRVDQSWKRGLSGLVTVMTDGTCAVPLVPGQRYLLFLHTLSASTYATDRCSGSASLAASERTLRWLQRQTASGEAKPRPALTAGSAQPAR